MTSKKKKVTKKVAKKLPLKVTHSCSTCIFSCETKKDIDYGIEGIVLHLWCRRHPTHKKMPVAHWCGEYKDK